MCNLERDIGFEPMTDSLEGCNSTAELITHIWCCIKDSNLKHPDYKSGALPIGANAANELHYTHTDNNFNNR